MGGHLSRRQGLRGRHGSGALTMALLRAVGDRGHVFSYEAREDFAQTAMKNIERYVGPSSNLTVRRKMCMKGLRKRNWIASFSTCRTLASGTSRPPPPCARAAFTLATCRPSSSHADRGSAYRVAVFP